MNFLRVSAFEQQPLPDFQSRSLRIFAEQLQVRQEPGYPAYEDRLRCKGIPYDERGLVDLPENGPWTAGDQTPDRTQYINEIVGLCGAPRLLKLDARNRVLHPYWKEMLTHPTVGAVVGKGFFWRWGVNYTADSAVFCQGHLLLVRRDDTGQWALPGGFRNPGESSIDASMREVGEESGLDLENYALKPESLYSGPVLDIRTTIHAWTETFLFRYLLNSPSLPAVKGADDATEAAWFPVDQLPADIYGSHSLLVEMATQPANQI